MRLGNLDVFCNAVKEEKERWSPESPHGIMWASILNLIEVCPTINPETLPIVQQLRAELARVTAERDAAVKNRAELADFELSACEGFCFGDARHDIPPCEWVVSGKCKLREWREVKPDGFCNEFKPKEDKEK